MRLTPLVAGLCCGLGGVHVQSHPHAAPPVRFEVKFSKPLAVYHYVQLLSSKARNTPFKPQFLNSRFAVAPYLGLVAAFDSIPTDYEYKFPLYSEGKIEGSTWYILKRNLILATSLDDFRTRSIAVIPSADLNRLVSILQAFTPVYDSLVYEPNRATFERQLRDIEALLAQKKADTLFDRIRAFYRASWDSSIPFVFVFYPHIGSGGFMATAYGNVSESELPTSMTDYPVILTLMLHEAAHILLDEQPRDLGWEIQSWFKANPARSSQYAKGLMQESWATAVANGFLREQLTGTLSSGSWYGQKYIDQMAKKLLPLLRPYLSTGKPMDRALVDAYVDIYEHTFLEWLSEWGNLMTGRAVISERPEDFDLLDRKFPYRNAQKYLRDFSDESLGQLRDSRMTKLLIVSRNNAAALARIRRFFPELADWRPDPAVDFTYSVLATDKTRLIVVNLVRGSLESQFNVPLAPLSSRVSPRLEDPMDVMTVNLARGCQHVTPISPSDLTSRLAGSGQRVAGVAMISLNATMNRRISSAVPTDTRRCSFIGGKGRPTRMSFF